MSPELRAHNQVGTNFLLLLVLFVVPNINMARPAFYLAKREIVLHYTR